MTTNYHLTVTTTGLTSQQVRWVMTYLGWTEVFCDDFIDKGRQCVRWHGTGCCRKDTDEVHATLVDQFQEHAGIFTLKTGWREETEWCPDCFRSIRRCMCDLLGDQTLADPEEEE